MSRVIAVTGANRGLGLEFISQYVQDPSNLVIAFQRSTDRSAIEKLQGGDKVKVITLDAGDDASVRKAFEETKKITDHIDILINNAAVNPGTYKLIEATDFAPIAETHDVNVIGPVRVTTTFLPLLRAGKEKKKPFGPIAPYSISKTGLNMVVATYANELSEEGFTCLAFDPGHVQTDMGGESAPLKAPESIKNMIGKIESVSADKDNGKFYAVKGDPGSAKMKEEDW